MGGGQYDCRGVRRAPNSAQAEGGKRTGNCGVSLEQDCALMRIRRLTAAVEKKLLAARNRRDAPAERVAAKIIENVRRRGDAGLSSWTKKWDGIDLTRTGM